jgi:hypothetical protein
MERLIVEGTIGARAVGRAAVQWLTDGRGSFLDNRCDTRSTLYNVWSEKCIK